MSLERRSDGQSQAVVIHLDSLGQLVSDLVLHLGIQLIQTAWTCLPGEASQVRNDRNKSVVGSPIEHLKLDEVSFADASKLKDELKGVRVREVWNTGGRRLDCLLSHTRVLRLKLSFFLALHHAF